MNAYRCIVLAGALTALALVPAEAAEGDHLLATPEKPAVVTVARVGTADNKTRGNPAVYVQVTGYQPSPGGGSVLIDVKAERPSGAERDIGKFGLSLDRPFTASDSSRAQTFRLRLPPDLVGTEPLRLKVYVVPSGGDARDARVEIGKAEIR